MRQFLLSLAITILMCSMSFAYDIGAQTKIQIDSASFIAVDRIADIAAVASKKNQTLSIVNTKTNAIINQVQLANTPSGVIIKDGKIIVSAVSGQLWLFNATGEIAAMINTDMGIVSLANGDLQTVIVASDDVIKSVDISKGELREILLVHGKNPKLYASQEKVLITEEVNGNTSVSILDKKSGNIGVTEIAGNVTSVGFDEQLNYFLTTMSGKTALSLFDVNSGISIGEIETNRLIANLSVNSSTHTAVVASLADGNMLVVGLISKLVEKSYPFFDTITETAVDPARNTAFVALNTDIATVKLENPVPVLDSLVPDSVAAGSEGFQLSIMGKKFIKDTQAWFNQKPLGLLFDSNELLKSDILPDELIYPGKVTISAENPPPGGGISNPLTFNILTPIPQIAGVTPNAVEVNIGSVVKVVGKNFLPNAKVFIDGKETETYFVSSIVLQAKIDVTVAGVEGIRTVSVVNTGETAAKSNLATLKIASTAEIQAIQANKSAAQTHQRGALKGRILNTRREPVANVTVSYKGLSTKTNANGHFVLHNIPEGRRTLLIDGSTADETKAYYPAIPVTAVIVANTVTQLSFTPHLHRQKIHDFVNIDSTKETVVTDPQMKGFELRIQKGNRIVGWDGRINDKVSMLTIPPDRLPIRPVPENSNVRTVTMFYFDKVGGGRPDKPVPFKSPNTLQLKPGEKATLWYYDESNADEEAPNDWAIAGTGTVSRDGRYIVTDEGVGIPKFCCGASAWGGISDDINLHSPNGHCPTLGGNPGTCAEGNCGASPSAGDPVDVSTGFFSHNDVDMVISGIIPVKIKRYYVSRLSGSAVAGNGPIGLGAFGKGWAFEFDWRVDTYMDVIRLKIPGGSFFDFALPDGNCDYSYTYSTATLLNNYAATMYAGLVDSSVASDAPNSLNYPFMVADGGAAGPPPIGYGGMSANSGGHGTCNNPEVTGIYRNSTNPEFMGAKITIENGLRVLTTRDGWRYVFETAGGLISLSDRNGNTVTITRHFNVLDNAGYIAKITNVEGQDIVFNQTADGIYFVQTHSIVAPDGRTIHYEYETDPFSNAYPRLKKVVKPDGTTVQYGYDTDGRMNTLVNGNGVTKFTNVYDVNNRVVSQTAQLSHLLI